MRPRNPILAALAALIFGVKGAPKSTIPDTSRRGTRADRGVASSGQPKVPTSTFFTFDSAEVDPKSKRPLRARKVSAPKGYAFNRRGDLVSLKRQALRQEAA
jgi:hypothetical protein